MKNYIIGLLFIVLGASGCREGRGESSTDGRNTLTFRTTLGKQTTARAAEFTNDSWVDGNTLVIHAHHEGSADEAYGDPIRLEYTAGEWSYGDQMASLDTRVWYYAWFPVPNTNISNEVEGIDTYSFDYSVPAAAEQEELIAAAVLTDEPIVNLEFRHILSQVNFGIIGVPGMRIEIEPESIEFTGLHDRGTYTLGQTPGWSDVGGSRGYTYTPLPGTTVADGESTDIIYMGNAGGETANDNDNALMLMPQTFGAGSEASLTFDYRLRTMFLDGSPNWISGENTWGTATVALKDLDTTAWAPGKRYLYLIDLTGYTVNGEISFAVVVNPWEEYEGNPVTSPTK